MNDCKFCDPNYEPYWPLTPQMEVACQYQCRHGSECGVATHKSRMYGSAVCNTCEKIYCSDHSNIIHRRDGMCEECYQEEKEMKLDNDCLYCDDGIFDAECDNYCGSWVCRKHLNKMVDGICHHCDV